MTSFKITKSERVDHYAELLRFMRPELSKTQRTFCRAYLEPVFGVADFAGNYTLQIGDKPNVMFAAHHDTVHAKGGKQKIVMEGDMIKLAKSSKANCLGADCTTGIFLILEMIRAGVPGFYSIFAGEEIGCKGSQDFVENRKSELADIKAVISFDRKGYDSIITHQCGMRTASDEFAESLASVIGIDLKADNTGAYTDSNEFAHHVSECTNLSVGYFAQHTSGEMQDVRFMLKLSDALIAADWSKLEFYRDPDAISELDYGRNYFRGRCDPFDDWNDDMGEFIRRHPDSIADWLESNGITLDDLKKELGIGSLYL